MYGTIIRPTQHPKTYTTHNKKKENTDGKKRKEKVIIVDDHMIKIISVH